MTTNEVQKRNEKAQQLKVLHADDNHFYVESSEGKILYKVVLSDDERSCSCGDFARGIKAASDFRCKHIIAVNNCISSGEFQEAHFLERKKPKLDERFIAEIEGKEFVLYAGLLDLGHQKGISKIDVEPLQFPKKDNDNFAICRATVISKCGEIFIDVGDANPGNCNSRVSRHLLRMASTRAIARALRSYTNIGMTCLEELADLNEMNGDQLPKSKPKGTKKSSGKANTEGNKPETKPEALSEDKPKTPEVKPQKPEPKKEEAKLESNQPEQATLPLMSEAQKRAIANLSRRRGISMDELEKMVREKYGVSLEELSSKDASTFISALQQAA